MRKSLTALAAIAALAFTAACGTDSEPTQADPAPTVTLPSSPDSEQAAETPTAAPEAPAAPVDEINDVTLSLLDEDGYTSDMRLRFPNWIFAVSLLDAKPGEADVVWSPPFDYEFSLINTTDQRRTPTNGVRIYGYYPESSPACTSVEGLTGHGYCARTLMRVEAHDDEIDPASSVWLEQDPESGLTGRTIRLPEDEAPALAEALSQPAGYIFATSSAVQVTAGADCRDLEMSHTDTGEAYGSPLTAIGPICG